MFVKQGSYYRARDAAQNGAQVDKFITSRRSVRSDASLKVRWFLYKKCVYLEKKEKESGEQRESTSTKLAVIFEDYHSTWPKEQ